MLVNLKVTFLRFERLPPERGEDAVRPVVGGHVQPPEHLRGRDSFRVHAHLPVEPQGHWHTDEAA